MLQARDEHGRQMRNPGPTALSRMVANLGRGNAFVIVERVDDETDGDSYVQVCLRDDNTYQPEFHNGTAAEHHHTPTISQEKAIVALSGWTMGRPDWRTPSCGTTSVLRSRALTDPAVAQLRRMGMTSGLVAGMVGRAASGVARTATMVTGLTQCGQLRMAVRLTDLRHRRTPPIAVTAGSSR
ncbi:hypothetical protein [Streptomyces violascens]|uniref:Uncharacterized protein n=1 Tax=Streptomyces violascens TaxID=67381 RepID=A0ABQ3QS89_9ACTN|nr:hypothetical protein [Streptomyces violascens]GHI40110.1 hypothetical protein Sviol_45180 [Streptomyces violascens]